MDIVSLAEVCGISKEFEAAAAATTLREALRSCAVNAFPICPDSEYVEGMCGLDLMGLVVSVDAAGVFVLFSDTSFFDCSEPCSATW